MRHARKHPELPDGHFIPPKPLRPADQIVVDAVRPLREPYSHAIPNRKALNTIAGTPHSCVSTGICTSGCPVGAIYKFSVRLLPEIAQLPNYQLRTDAKVLRLVADAKGRHVSSVEYLDTGTIAAQVSITPARQPCRVPRAMASLMRT